MAGLGLLFGALGGAGRGVSQVAAEDQRVAADRERMRLEEERQLRIDELRRQRDVNAARQQGADITAETTRLQNQRDADAINAQFGSSMTAEDAQALRSNPEARKAYGLLASNRQGDLEDRATAAERLGHLDAAREARGALQTEIANQRNQNLDEDSKRRLDQQEKRQTSLDEYNKRRENRLDRLAEAQLSFQQARARKLDEGEDKQVQRELRLATQNALQGVTNQLKDLQKEAGDPLLEPERKKALTSQLEDLRAEAAVYRKRLAGAGLDDAEPARPNKPFNPDDFRLGGRPTAAPSQSAANPARGEISEPVERRPAAVASPQTQARQAIDSAIRQTVGDLTAANNRGDRAEVQRLNAILQEQQAAKARM